jgi:hypothetical protein
MKTNLDVETINWRAVMRENRQYGSEVGEGKPFPTPVPRPTVIHIETKNDEYRLVTDGVRSALRGSLGFMLKNDILNGRQIVFFTDEVRK